MLQARGELPQALELHRADVEITASALASDPGNTDSEWRLAAALHLLGELQEDLGDYAAAADNFEQALAISTELVNRDAENARWQHELGIAHAAIGRIRRINGGVKSALTHFRQSAAIMDRLVTLDDSLSEWRADAAWAHYWVAEAMLAMGDPEAAEREVAIAIAIGEQLLADVPDERQALPVVGEAYMLLGQIAARAGAGEESRVAFDRAAEILEPVARDSTDKTYLDPWARAVLHLDRVEDARPVVEELHRMGFKGWRLGELCQVKGVSMEGPVQQPGI